MTGRATAVGLLSFVAMASSLPATRAAGPEGGRGPASTSTPAALRADIRDYGADPTGVEDSAVAINKAFVARRVAYAPCGQYLLRRSVLIPSDATLLGAGRCTVFVVPDAGFTGERVITNADTQRGNSRITISDFSVRVRSPHPVGGRNPGVIRFEKVDGLTIRRIFTDRYASEYDVVHLVGVRSAIVQGCVLRNTHAARSGGALGVYGGPVRDASYDSFDIRVEGNTFESAFDEAIAVYGWFTSVKHARIRRNTIQNRGPTEVALGVLGSNHGQRGVVQRIEISDNVVVGKTNILTGASDVTFTRNRITGPSAGGQDAIFVAAANGPAPTDIALVGNSIRGAARYGIFAAARNVTVRKNRIRGTRSYAVYGGSNVLDNEISAPGSVGIFHTAGSTLVRGNTIVGCSTGIAFYGSGEGLRITGNTVVDATSDGISVNADGGTVSDVEIVGNVVRASPGGSTGNGVRTWNGEFPRCRVSGNRITGARRDHVLAAGCELPP